MFFKRLVEFSKIFDEVEILVKVSDDYGFNYLVIRLIFWKLLVFFFKFFDNNF